MRGRGATRFAVLATAALSLFASCGDQVVRAPDVAVPSLRLHVYATSPIKAALGTNGEALGTIRLATQALIQRCMNKSGFRYDIVNVANGPESDVIPLTVERARTRGYTSDDALALDGTGTSADQTMYAAINETNADAYGLALDGSDADQLLLDVPDGPVFIPGAGCRFEAERAIVGDVRAHEERTTLAGQLARLVAEAHERAELTQAWRDVVSKWSKCVEKAGFGKGFTIETFVLAHQFDTDAELRRAAVVDATCREANLLDETRAALFAAFESDALERTPELTQRYAAVLRSQLERAVQTLRDLG